MMTDLGNELFLREEAAIHNPDVSGHNSNSLSLLEICAESLHHVPIIFF